MNDEPTSEILDATYHALCKHGYAALTLQHIADESAMSKASIHYYYDSKNELFVAFLDFLYDRYTTQIDSTARDSPREHLRSLLEVLLTDEEDTPGTEFRTAMLEVTAQAPYDDKKSGTDSSNSATISSNGYERLSRLESTPANSTKALLRNVLLRYLRQ